MPRTRAGLLDGALRAVLKQGPRRTTMTDVAAFAGVAKATLYNHFRTKDDVFAALVELEVEAIAAECRGRSLDAALVHAAWRLSTHPGVRRVAADDPAALARLVTGGDGPGWQAARRAVRAALEPARLAGDDLVLRWLSSHLATPGSDESVREGAAALLAGLDSSAGRDRDLPTAADRS
ncbi:MAG: TetR/AcrR family transcriptional regulator [Actinomycetota bacterium]|nr:TetR/AcrR family transcriptional regulator [Actinomycetota bacterium]